MIEWKYIDGYDGYMVSSIGTVKSMPKGKGNGNKERILKHDISNKGYARVTLSRNGVTKRFSVHRLVANAFCEKSSDRDCVNHIDNNPLNNNASNLEWCTHSENMIHAEKQGRLYSSQSNGGSKAGKIANEKAIEEHKKLVGEEFGLWKVLEYYGKKNGKGRFFLTCLCQGCNETVKEVEVTTLKTGASIRCRSCGMKNITEKVN